MLNKCGPACFACLHLSYEHRCPIPKDAPTAWKPGDLNKLFERLATDPIYQQHNPTVLSNSPWVVTLDNFLTAQECDALIQLGTERGYERSFFVDVDSDGKTQTKVEHDSRTSAHTWCEDSCYNNTITQAIRQKIETLTGIPDQHSEFLQLVRYEEGQYYKLHHDCAPPDFKDPQGPRIMTVFIYLNDVEGGGGTRFPGLNLTVMPARGKVLIWPSVMNDDPGTEIDLRTEHEALPVEKGIKYAANAWVRLAAVVTRGSCISHAAVVG
jgi:prolyl 4-hydroxylase